MGSCGSIYDNDLVIALGAVGQGQCGQCVTIRSGGKCLNVKIMDTCASCGTGKIDLTPAVFQHFAPLSAGLISVDYDFSCSCGNGGAPAAQPAQPAQVAQAPAHHAPAQKSDIGYCTQSNDFTQCASGCCYQGQCHLREVCFGSH